jgi:hypothetical protein
MTPQVFMGVGCLEVFLVPVTPVYECNPAELCLAEQCLKWMSVKGPHEACVFRMTCCSKRLLLYVRGHRGTPGPHGLQTIADAIVPCRGHTIVAALVEFTGILLLLSTYQDVR